MASIIKVDRILDSTELGKVDIPGGIETTELVANTWKNVDGTENYKCKAFVNFDGTTTPPTIRASGNVSSVVRNNAGDYTVSFTGSMPDANYAPSYAGEPFRVLPSTNLTTSFRFTTQNASAVNTSYSDIYIVIHR